MPLGAEPIARTVASRKVEVVLVADEAVEVVEGSQITKESKVGSGAWRLRNGPNGGSKLESEEGEKDCWPEIKEQDGSKRANEARTEYRGSWS